MIVLSIFTPVLFSAQKVKNGEIFKPNVTEKQKQLAGGYIKCATTEYEDYLQKIDPNRMSQQEFEAWLKPFVEKAKTNKSQSGNIITIPVVVHVVSSGQPVGVAPNITDAQVISQINVMNQDFRRMAGTPGANNSPVGADTMIQFALATVDPAGNPTNGINRVSYCGIDSWSTGAINGYLKPDTIWNPNNYMNMWSVSFSQQGLLGYAQFPSASGLPGLSTNGGGANTDGVVAGFYCFGTSAENDGTFILGNNVDRGRTMTHEVGHFLGLRHLWGDGDCTVDDFCADTPVSSDVNNMHYSCNVNQDSCPSEPGLDMVRNYMNYTLDTCMNIFTQDQAARMAAVMNASPRRSTLATSVADLPIQLFANDAEVKLRDVCSASEGSCASQPGVLPVTIYNRGTSPLTSATITYTVNGGAVQTYNWTGNLALHKFQDVNIPVPAAVQSGNVSVTVTQANNVADQRATNNTVSGLYQNNHAEGVNFDFSTVVFNLQLDNYGSETTWNLKDSSGNILHQGGPYADSQTLPAPIVQTWNLTPNACYTLTINDAYGDGICCGGGNGSYSLKNQAGTVTIAQGGSFPNVVSHNFKMQVLSTNETSVKQLNIYPNPVLDILHVSGVGSKAAYVIHNAASQLVKRGLVQDNKVDVSALVKGNYIITVTDNDQTLSSKFIKK